MSSNRPRMRSVVSPSLDAPLEPAHHHSGRAFEGASGADLSAELIGGAAGLTPGADQMMAIQMEAERGDLIRVKIDAEIVTDVADYPDQMAVAALDALAVIIVQQQPARGFGQMARPAIQSRA